MTQDELYAALPEMRTLDRRLDEFQDAPLHCKIALAEDVVTAARACIKRLAEIVLEGRPDA